LSGGFLRLELFNPGRFPMMGKLSMANPEATPTVSVIIATYNRSNVLAIAIKSVLAQSYPHWELLVIGDACTDDTAAVVAGFGDARIRFHNLAQNVGEMSGPNNEGMRQAKGKYFAFLNHDDLWFPEHLQEAVAALEKGETDLVFALTAVGEPESRHFLYGATPTGAYDPGMFVPATSWVFRRELFESVGPWKFYRDIHNFPSQDWLFRAWQSGKRLRLQPKLTVMFLPSVAQPDAYAKRLSQQQEDYWQRIQKDPTLRERELLEHALSFRTEALKWYPVGVLLKSAFKNLVRKMTLKLGWHPATIHYWLTDRRKGSAIDRARQRRGLPPKGK
jgi:glycosyltransferase involved in cell wall biosynthesis